MKRLLLCLIICSVVPMCPRSSKVDYPVSSHRKMKKRYVVTGVLAAALLGLILFLGLFFGLRSDSGDTHTYKRAAVATDAGQCSIIGRYPLIVLWLLLALTALAQDKTVVSSMSRCSCPAQIISNLPVEREGHNKTWAFTMPDQCYCNFSKTT